MGVPASVAPSAPGTVREPRPPREAQLRSPRLRPPLPRFCGKEAAGAGVAAGASCSCDRAERGTRGHVGKTLVPAALPARNAPPAPQSPPAWPRNGDSHAPRSHPLGAHPEQPTKSLASELSLPALAAGGPLYLPCPASTGPGSGSQEPQSSSRASWDAYASSSSSSSTGLPVLGLLGIATPLGTYYPGLPLSLRKYSPRAPHIQHKAENTGQINNNQEPVQHLEAANRPFVWEDCPRTTYLNLIKHDRGP